MNEKAKVHNDKIDKQKADYAVALTKAERDYQSAAAKEKRETEAYENRYGYDGATDKEYSKRLNVALNYYNGLSKKEAIKQIENSPQLKLLLGNKLNDLVRLTYNRD